MDWLAGNSALQAAQKRKQAAFHWVVHLGAPGVLIVSFLDASIIPLAIPGSTDLLLLWLISHGSSPWLMVPCAWVASVAGAWTTWRIGKKGGEAAFNRYVPSRIKKRVHGWTQRHPLLMVFLPAILPPPIPLWPFLLAAGALGATWKRFLTAFGSGRALRYGLEGWLAVAYGRYMVHLWSATLRTWGPAVLWSFGALSAVSLAWSMWKLRHSNGRDHAVGSLHPSNAK